MQHTLNSKLLPKGTERGKLEEINPIDDLVSKDEFDSNETSVKLREISQDDLTQPEREVIDKMVANLPDELTPVQREKVRDLLVQYKAILSTDEFDIGRTHLVEHKIDTGEARLIRQPLRRQVFAHQQFIKEKTERMMEHGLIEPAASPWASNVVLMKKKDGLLQFCVDYRKLNSVTYKDSYPLPLIDNCLNALSGSSWFSTLDLRLGYHNIPIAEQDRDKLAFITQQGCFRYTVNP